MIQKLRIQNFALIEDVTIDFSDGLVVLSGETGSGKSIFMNAINFLIGDRTDKNFIRYGSSFLQVDGVFDVDLKTQQICAELGIDAADELLISRRINLDGKSEVRINGSITTLNMLKTITRHLVDVYGQHQHQSLLNENTHIGFVDAYSMPKGLEELKEIVSKINEINKNLEQFGGDESKRQREIDIIKFELNELEEADLKVGEDEILLEKQKKFQNVQKVLEAINQATSFLEGDETFSISSCLGGAIKSLNTISTVEDSVLPQTERMSNMLIELEDIRESLSDILGGYEFSENEFEEVEARLLILKNIKRKYGGDLESAIKYQTDLVEKLAFLENSEQDCEKLVAEKQNLEDSAWKICLSIREKRQENAKNLELSMLEQFKNLGMENAKFVVQFKSLDAFTSFGADSVKFMFSANMGEPLKPLSSVISGGEMSRFMLAFKTVMGNKNGVPTLLFDEIDNGIGGEVGFAVGCKLAEISKNAQVIVVTHLASIGAMADQHYKVEKKVEDDRTHTIISKLDDSEQLLEIARLAGGLNGGFASEYAKQLKQRAIQSKN